MQGPQIKQINNQLTKLLDLKVISYVNIHSVGDGYYQVVAEPIVDVNLKSLNHVDNNYNNILDVIEYYYQQAKTQETFFEFNKAFKFIIDTLHWAEHGTRWIIAGLIIAWCVSSMRRWDITFQEIYDILKDFLL